MNDRINFRDDPMELKVIIGSGIIMGLLQSLGKDKVWEKQQQKNQK